MHYIIVVAYSGSYESCQLLVQAGADVNAQDRSYGDLATPLHKALRGKLDFIVRDGYGISTGAQSRTVRISRYDNIVNSLLSAKASTNIPDISGVTVEEMLQNSSTSMLEIVNSDSKFVIDSNKCSENNSVYCSFISPSNSSTNTITKESEAGRKESVNSSTSIGRPCDYCQEVKISFTKLKNSKIICSKCKKKLKNNW